MEKLSKINEELLGKNNLKKIFKKGMQIGVLGAALAAGTIMGTSCSQPTNDGGYTYDNDDQGKNPSNTDKGNYSQPYDKTIGNGNYVFHNFIGTGVDIQPKTVVDDVNYYLGKGETYIKGLADKFNQSLEGRPAAQSYFSGYINALENNNKYHIDETNSGGNNLDQALIANSKNSEYIFTDIIKNLNTPEERGIFYYSYRLLANEAYKEGLGNFRNYGSAIMDNYNKEKQDIKDLWEGGLPSTDFDNDINNQNCRQITNYIDDSLNIACE